jgi:hypothetical protein
VMKILEFCDTEEIMREQETYWIQTLSANKLKYPECGGMNLNDGGCIWENYPNKDEILLKLKENHIGYW